MWIMYTLPFSLLKTLVLLVLHVLTAQLYQVKMRLHERIEPIYPEYNVLAQMWFINRKLKLQYYEKEY